jgi:hypothetical protein
MSTGEAQDEKAVIEEARKEFYRLGGSDSVYGQAARESFIRQHLNPSIPPNVRSMPVAMFPGLVGETGGDRRFTRAEVLTVLKSRAALARWATTSKGEGRQDIREAELSELIGIFERME